MSQGGRPKPDYDPDTLRRWHHNDGLAVKEIAERLGRHVSTVGDWMRAEGIDVRRQKSPLGLGAGTRGRVSLRKR